MAIEPKTTREHIVALYGSPEEQIIRQRTRT